MKPRGAKQRVPGEMNSPALDSCRYPPKPEDERAPKLRCREVKLLLTLILLLCSSAEKIDPMEKGGLLFDCSLESDLFGFQLNCGAKRVIKAQGKAKDLPCVT